MFVNRAGAHTSVSVPAPASSTMSSVPLTGTSDFWLSCFVVMPPQPWRLWLFLHACATPGADASAGGHRALAKEARPARELAYARSLNQRVRQHRCLAIWRSGRVRRLHWCRRALTASACREMVMNAGDALRPRR